MRFGARETVIGAALLLAACSLSTIPDLTSGTRAIIPSLDAGDSGGALDSGARLDAGGRSAFCETVTPRPGFCDDFDTADLNRWGTVHRFDGKFGVSLEGDGAKSSPNALLARVEAGSPDCTYATVGHDFSGAFRAAHLSFALRVEADELASPRSVVAMLSFGSGDRLCQVYFAASAVDFAVAEQLIHDDGRPREGRTYPITPAPRAGVWTRVAIDYDVAATSLTVDVDGQRALGVTPALACPYTPGNAGADFGLFCEPPRTANRAVHLDDVVFDPR